MTDQIVLEASNALLGVDDQATTNSKKPRKDDAAMQVASLLAAVDKYLIQLKHCSKWIADRFIALFSQTSLFSGKRLKVASMIASFWASPNLNRIASPRQLLYVTYLLYHCLRICGPTAFTDLNQSQLFESIRTGIQERI